jgi:ribose transport system substrate-binding protein
MRHYGMLTLIAACASAFAVSAQAVRAAEPYFLTNPTTHKPPFKIGLSNGFIGNTWRAQFLEDIQAASAELKADGDIASITILNSTSGTSGQIAQINSLINSGVDAIVINPVSGEALKPVISRAVAAGIFVTIADDPLAHPNVLTVTLDQRQFWDIETHWLIDQLKGKGDIVSVEGLAGNTANDLRVQERNAILKDYPDIKMMDSIPGGWDQAQARQVMTSMIAAHPKIDAILTQDVMVEGEILAFQSAGRPLPLITGDYTHSFLKVWKSRDGMQSIAVANPPGIGADGLMVTAMMLRGHKLKDAVLVGNPLDPKLRNTVVIPQPVVITREPETDKPWCKVGTECISLDEALKRLDGKPDTAAIDSWLSEEQVLDRYFEK